MRKYAIFVKGAQFMYENFEQLLQKNGITSYKVSKETGVTQTALSNWKSGRSTPTTKTLQKLADYFGVTIDYLLAGNENIADNKELSKKDMRDISNDIESIMKKLSSKEYGPAAYDGEDLSEESASLFKEELEIALKRLKFINKEKYNPNKNKE